MRSKKEFKMIKEESYRLLRIKCEIIMLIRNIKGGLCDIKRKLFQ